jgi:hypothetical protein
VIDAAAIRGALARDGFALLEPGRVPEAALADPWALVASLVGERPLLVERQPIRPVEGGRSFASTQVETPLHTDSQDLLGAAPALQVMACRRAADEGGESLLLDGLALALALERDDPALFHALFAVRRTIPFYFGDVVAPTIAIRRGALAFTCSPMPPADDVGVRLARAMARVPPCVVAVPTGATLLVDNHRMLHGRRAFADPRRAFLRLLAWLPTPLSRPARLLEAARPHAAPRDLEPIAPELGVVVAQLAGVPPARLAAEERVAEAELYRMRGAALGAAEEALRARRGR